MTDATGTAFQPDPHAAPWPPSPPTAPPPPWMTQTRTGPPPNAPWWPGPSAPGSSGPAPHAAPPGAMSGPGAPGGPHPPRPAPANRRPPEPALSPDRRSLIAVVVIAIATDIALRTRLDGFAGFLLVVVASTALVLSGRLPRRQTKIIALLAIPFGLCLTVRTSWWLVPLDVFVIAGLFGVAVMFGRGGNVFDVRAREIGQRIVNVIIGVVMAPVFVFGAVAASLPTSNDERRERRVAIARGLGFALPVLVVLGLLLASSDAVFASLFHVPVDGDSLLANGLLLCIGLWVAGALLRTASEPNPRPMRTGSKPFGAIEATILLGGLILLYGAFALTQLFTAMGGADHVLRTAHLTRADYARSGFFQLLAVAGITLAVLAAMKSLSDVGDSTRVRRVVVWMSEIAVGLTLVIVAVAIVRLNLYDDAYGLTMLRFMSLATAWWLGGVFVLVGIALAGVGEKRHWLLAAIAASALVALLGLNAIGPESLVVSHNANRYEAALAEGKAVDFDVSYTELLSDDAVPAIAEALPKLDAWQQGRALDRICGTDRRGKRSSAAANDAGRASQGVMGWNRSAADAQRIREELCR